MATKSQHLSDLVPLGQSGLRIPPLGIGTWQWGDRLWWQYGKSYGDAELEAAFKIGVARGVRLFDSAEIYGMGTSERLLGAFSRDHDDTVIATKFFPFPWRLRQGDVARALDGSLRRLGRERVDLYQIHWPLPPVPLERWMSGLADAVHRGQARAVGVSNYTQRQTVRAALALQRHGVPLASNQVAYSLLNRAPERNGVLEACRALGVAVIAYSPLAMGMLSGKYTPENPPPGIRGRRYPPGRLREIQPLVAAVARIGTERGNTTSQVALNWVICKGAIPIPGAKNAQQAEENVGALGWRLSADEVAELDEVSGSVGARG